MLIVHYLGGPAQLLHAGRVGCCIFRGWPCCGRDLRADRPYPEERIDLNRRSGWLLPEPGCGFYITFTDVAPGILPLFATLIKTRIKTPAPLCLWADAPVYTQFSSGG